MKQWLTIVFCLFFLMCAFAQQPADSLGYQSTDSVEQVAADGAATTPIVYKAVVNDDHSDGSHSSFREFFFSLTTIIASFILLSSIIGCYVLVYVMANKRGRDAETWVMVSIFITPFIACLLILLLGKSKKKC